MLFYGLIVLGGFFGGYYAAAAYAGATTSAVGSAVRTAELDALGLLDDNPTDTNNSSAGGP